MMYEGLEGLSHFIGVDFKHLLLSSEGQVAIWKLGVGVKIGKRDWALTDCLSQLFVLYVFWLTFFKEEHMVLTVQGGFAFF